MSGGKHLLLLAVFLQLARCQYKPQVSMLPALKQIFSGDLFYLSCSITNGNTVKWYINNAEQKMTNKTWKIAVAAPMHSGSYQCESNGQKSDNFLIEVLEFAPSATLTVKTGHPVMQIGSSVVLQLDNDDGLQGWECRVYKGEKEKKIKLKQKTDSVNIVFQPSMLNVPETIFWCIDSTKQIRSNQQVIRTSGKDISLEMYPLPAVVGESLTLRCLVWGTDQITKAVFYKDDAKIQDSNTPTHNIAIVTQSTEGRYKCDATFTYVARTAGLSYHKVSDMQDVFVQAPSTKAVLSESNGLSCSCPVEMSGEMSYHYYKKDRQAWTLVESGKTSMKPNRSGTYACRAVWKNKRSLLSNTYNFSDLSESNSTPTGLIVGVVVLMIGGVILTAVWFYKRYKQNNNEGPIYEDVQLRSRDEGDDRYEQLQRAGGMEGGYDTIHTETQGRKKKEGEYEALEKDKIKEGVYRTLEMEGEAAGAGYEALKKGEMKEGVYHTLEIEGAAGGVGGYGKEGKKDKDDEIEKEMKAEEQKTEP